MIDKETLWEQACALLVQNMNYVSYTTWVEDNMVPVALDGNTLVISVKMEGMISMIQKKYLPLIEKCLSESAGEQMKARLMGKNAAEVLVHPDEEDHDDSDPHLNPKYTFENFVLGDANRFAYAAALAVAESPTEAYNPLFIYGGVGLGKTHLMQAIGHFVRQNDPQKKIMYITSESFTNEMISAIQQKKTYEFREKIRKVDVLMVDDIQFIAGRESTQREFFNTFNELYNDNKRIVLTSDKPPKDIQRLEERLCSRFEWGLVADIQRPDVDTRLAILKGKAKQENISVPDDVLQMIAVQIDSNVRELEGCLSRLVAFSNMTGRPITPELCEEAMKGVLDQKRHKQVTAELIMNTASDFYGLTLNDLTGPTRKREITVPRQIAMYLTREMTGMSLPQIGNAFGGRDHTTVMHSCKTVEAAMVTNPNLRLVVDEIKRLVKNSM
ncbi:MAG: chromosomal replication initiator protein DnaA [Clostridia bacterium]|nr:chromosomal replication initiator protein DnaA [Clostridia bacterium]